MRLTERVKTAWNAVKGIAPTPERVLAWRRAGRGGGGGAMASGGYDSGEITRFDPDFVPGLSGPNAMAERNLDRVRQRVTALVNNNPIIAGVRRLIINNVCGTGIWPQPDTGDTELDKQISDLWWSVADNVDPDREMTISQSQRQWFGEIFRVGEGMVNLPTVDAWRGVARGPAIEIIDTDRMPLSFTSIGSDVKRIRQGVEYDDIGRRLAYHVLTEHPADNAWWIGGVAGMIGSKNVRRLDAIDARLGFFRDDSRPGAIRGVPWAQSIVGDSRMEEGFREAALLQARIAASLGFIITETGAVSPLKPNATSPLTGPDGLPLNEISPGMLGVLAKGKISTVGGNLPGPMLGAAIEIMLRRCSAGLNVSYATLARDYSKVNFSSIRASTLEDRKGYRGGQELTWHEHTRPFYRRLIDWGISTGKIKLTAENYAKMRIAPEWIYSATVIYPGWQWVNPQQEASANDLALRGGVTTLSAVCADMGFHWQDVLRQRVREEVAWNKERKDANLEPAPLYGATPGMGQSAPAQEKPVDENGDPIEDGTGGPTAPDGEGA